ncbi:winged helix-turn-helix domain-containing protein [Natronobacterium gregoryi]|uniref:Transcriptional regulator n=2 Tax=Natronobacterium gregoryi TaxID=44930 RepID=L0AD77_NATGS|nr:winged helix-turn-helix domain-containing protein [Natronobacterium gregoryi]AFZ71384.1 transcriptional regulator [Natronobacterium gregoryi SP2]ELY66909.1 transcriptional regulator TrmB [Natronobacterium gregoryi SP2]PLK21236.1 ArsR family transcriptional regulator [Natronobacterium gregoryi SP2]SFI84958.1 Helix-turn-helix domain-containing protein [Natronobacterium gregoryi]
MSLGGSPSHDSVDLDAVVGALDDDGCRQIVAALEEPLTVTELADRTELPLSTTYRKLDRLTEARLVTETSGIRQGSHHKARYIGDFDRISISLDDDRSFDVDVGRSSDVPADIWMDAKGRF